MFEETPEKEKQERDPLEALAAVLARYESRPLLKKIEKNTAVLPSLLRALTVARGTRGAHVYVRDLPPPQKAARAAVMRDLGTRTAGATTPRTVTRTARTAPPTPAAVLTPPATPAPVPAAAAPATPAQVPRQAPAPVAERDTRGRFQGRSAGQEERERQNQEQQAKGLKGLFKSVLSFAVGKGKEKEGDIQDAVGKSLGGPIWEAAKEMQGAVGELKEKLADDKSLVGKAARWLGKKTGILKGPTAPPTEGAEQRRHRELLHALEGAGGSGGGGGGGIADAVEGGIGGLVGGQLLSRIPGGSIAARFLAKAGPVLGVLTSGTVLAGVAAAGSVLAAGKSLIFGGSNPINDLYEKLGGPKASTSPTQDTGFRDNYGKFQGTVKAAAAENGISEDYMKTMMKIESGGVNSAVSSTGAKGLYQFTGGTAKAYGIQGREFDPAANIQAAARLAKDNAGALQKRGVPVTDANLYLAHQLGVGGEGKGGVTDLLNATKTGQVSPALRKQMDLNGGKGMDATAYLKFWQNKYMKSAVEAEADPNAMARRKAAPGKPEAAVATAAKAPVQAVTQPKPQRERTPAPVTAQLEGADKLVAALEKQKAPHQDKAPVLPPIKTHFDDTLVNLMAHDRI